MSTSTRPNGFPTLNTSTSNNRSATSLNTQSFSASAWQQSSNIWGNGIGNSISASRDTAGSRGTSGSEDLSPTAPPGSAQLSNPLTESEHSWRSRVWDQATTTAGGITNGVSPTAARARGGFPYGLNDANSSQQPYPLRQNGSQVLSGLPNRAGPSGSSENPTSAMRYGSIVGNGMAHEETGTASAYGMESSVPSRRASADPRSLFASRQTENRLQYNNNSGYSYGPNSGQNVPRTQRPSVSGASSTLASEIGRSQAYNHPGDAVTSDLNDSFNRALNLDDTSESNNLYARGSVPMNPASQPFQFNPGSQPWQHDLNNGGRSFGQAVTQDTWADASYHGPRAGSIIDRGSPAGGPYRSHLGSPRRYSTTPSARNEGWPAQGSRHPSVSQELDRQQHGAQYLHQQSNYYQPPAAPYYPPSGVQYQTQYDQYQQVPNFHHQIPPTGYNVPLNFVPLPVPRPQNQDDHKTHRSPLLAEFLANSKTNPRRFELKDIYNHISEFSGDQNGSRFVQEKLTTANSEEKEQVFREIEPNLLQLMMDLFGNYVIQKFFEHGTQIQKKIMAAAMRGKIAELSVQTYACRVVQKALEHILVEQQAEFVEELKPTILTIAKHCNGNHVIQKIVEVAPRLCVQSLLDAMRGQVDRLSAQNFACRVIQRMLEKGTEQEKKALMDELHVSAKSLIPDQYGNYVMQHIIVYGNPYDRRKIIEEVLKRVVALSQHKYASNVVEKCIVYGAPDQKDRIYAALTKIDEAGKCMIETLLRDQYGNYVIQKLVNNLPEPQLEAFFDKHEQDFQKWATGGKAELVNKAIATFEKPRSRRPATDGDAGNGNVVNGNAAMNGSPTNATVASNVVSSNASVNGSAYSGTTIDGSNAGHAAANGSICDSTDSSNTTKALSSNFLAEIKSSGPTPPPDDEKTSARSNLSPGTNTSATYDMIAEHKPGPRQD